MIKLNGRFLAILLVAVAAGAGLVHLLHGAQVRRNADQYREQARSALERGDAALGAKLLGRYLELEHADADAYEDYARLLHQAARTAADRSGVASVYQLVLQIDPGRDDVREELARLQLDLGERGAAEANFKLLLEGRDAPVPPEGTDRRRIAELWRLWGTCLETKGDLPGAEQKYRKAIALDPGEIEAHVLLADLLRGARVNRKDEADAVMDRLVEANPESGRAHVERALYGRRYHRDDRRVSLDLERAIGLAPDDEGVIAAIAGLSRSPEEIARARTLVERTIGTHPDSRRLYLALTDLETRAGRTEAALEALRRGERAVGNPEAGGLDADLSWRRAVLLLDLGRVAEAEPLVADYAKLTDSTPEARYLAGLIQLRKALASGDEDGSRDQLELAIKELSSIRSAEAGTWAPKLAYTLAVAHAALEDVSDAIIKYNEAARAAPGWSQPVLAIADLVAGEDLDSALKAVELRLAETPDDPELLVKMAQLRFVEQKQRADDLRDWSIFRAALKRARRGVAARVGGGGPVAEEDAFLHSRPLWELEIAQRSETGRADEVPALIERYMQANPGEMVALLSRQAEGASEEDRRVGRVAAARYALSRGLVEEARVLVESEARDGSFPPAIELLASIALRTGESRLALEQATRLVELTPESLGARLILARACAAAGDRGRASAELDEAHDLLGSLEAGEEPWVPSIVALDLQFGRDAEATELAKSLVDSAPAQVAAVAPSLAGAGYAEQALGLCDAASAAGARSEAARAAIQVAALAGDPEGPASRRARQLVDRALQEQPADVPLLLSSAALHHQAGEFEREVDCLRRVWQREPADVRFLNNLAWLLSESLGRPGEALPYIDAAIERMGRLPGMLDTRGVILSRLGRHDEAASMFREAIEQEADPRPERLHHLAVAYRAQGLDELYRKTLDLALRSGLKPESLTPEERGLSGANSR